MQLIEKFEYRGEWWLPGRDERKVSGTLKFSPNEGAKLELIGSFREARDYDKMTAHEIILGISIDGRNITLHKCFETELSGVLSGPQASSFLIQTVFV